MDRETENLIEEEIYPMIVTPIEQYIKPNMTSSERVIAKQKVFFRIKELLRGAQIATKLPANEISEIIKSMMKKRENLHEGAKVQHELITEILDEIKKQSEKEDKSI